MSASWWQLVFMGRSTKRTRMWKKIPGRISNFQPDEGRTLKESDYRDHRFARSTNRPHMMLLAILSISAAIEPMGLRSCRANFSLYHSRTHKNRSFQSTMNPPCLPASIPKNENITVFVSSSRFCIVPSLFKKVEKLNWQQKKGGFRYLNANADAFEVLLQFLMFQKLPKTTNMTSRLASEVFKLTKPLDNVEALVDHVTIFLEARHQRNGVKTSSLLGRRFPSLKSTSPKASVAEIGAQPPREGGTRSSVSSSSSSSSSAPHEVVDETMQIFSSVRQRPVATVEILPESDVWKNVLLPSGRYLEHRHSGLTEDEDTASTTVPSTTTIVPTTITAATVVPINPFDLFPIEPVPSHSLTATIDKTSTATTTTTIDLSVAFPEIQVDPDVDGENDDPADSSLVKSIRMTSKALLKKAVKKIKDQQVLRAHKTLVASEYVM